MWLACTPLDHAYVRRVPPKSGQSIPAPCPPADYLTSPTSHHTGGVVASEEGMVTATITPVWGDGASPSSAKAQKNAGMGHLPVCTPKPGPCLPGFRHPVKRFARVVMRWASRTFHAFSKIACPACSACLDLLMRDTRKCRSLDPLRQRIPVMRWRHLKSVPSNAECTITVQECISSKFPPGQCSTN